MIKSYNIFCYKIIQSLYKMNDPRSCGNSPVSSPSSSSSRSSSVSSRCSSRSRESTPDFEDSFIVDDGYKHYEDPDYVPNNQKYVVTGKEFRKLTKKAQLLGAETLDYSTRKNNKYMVTLPEGKKVHFGSPKYPDYLYHKDQERRDKYLSRATKIKNRQGDLTHELIESPNYWSSKLLW